MPFDSKKIIGRLKTENIKKVYFNGVQLLANSSSGDFREIVFELEKETLILSSEFLSKTANGDDDICRLNFDTDNQSEYTVFHCIKSTKENKIELVTELVNEYGYLDGLELKFGDKFIFLFAENGGEIAVAVSIYETLRYDCYSHQFKEPKDFPIETEYVKFFSC